MSDQPHERDGADAWESIARHLSGEAGPEARARMEAHLAAHPERKALVDEMARALGAVDEPALPPERVEAALARVLARRDAEPSVSPPPARIAPAARAPRRWLRPALAAAAVAALAVSAALLRRGGPDAPPAVEHATGVGETERVALADGSTATLGPGSRLTVAGRYGAEERGLRLEGEAYFRVAHGGPPFVVRTAGAAVRDIGTAFTVRADAGGATSVAVTEGSVALSPASEAGSEVLRAGDRGRVDAGGRVTVERGASRDDAAAWTEGRLVVRDATMAEVAAEFRRWYGVVLVVPDGAARRRVTATFPTGSPGEALAVLEAVTATRVERRGDTAVVTLPRP